MANSPVRQAEPDIPLRGRGQIARGGTRSADGVLRNALVGGLPGGNYPAPVNAKPNVDMMPAQSWLDSLSEAQLRLANKLAGWIGPA